MDITSVIADLRSQRDNIAQATGAVTASDVEQAFDAYRHDGKKPKKPVQQ